MKLLFIGGWGHHYLRELLKPGVSPVPLEVAAASDGHDSDAARRWSETHGVSKWFDDPVAAMAEFAPDAVSVGSVYGFNGDLVAQAWGRDIPVVSDKPVAATWQQLAKLKDMARNGRRVLLTEFDFRCKREFRSAHAAVEKGLVGEVALVTAQKSYRFGTRPAWYADRASYGGTMLWIASHGIDAIEWVTGRKIVRVVGRQGNVSKKSYGSMEEHLAIVMELDNGGTGVVHADYLRPAKASTHGDDRLRIAGGAGVVEVRGERCLLITHDDGERDITEMAGEVRPMHLELLAALQGEKSRWFSTELSLATAELLLKARDAADGGTWVPAS